MEQRERQDAIEAHLPLVRSLARRYAFAGEPLEDLEQVGALGLIKAVDRFDAGRSTPLAAYAAPVILGEIRHHVRDRVTPVRIPRRVGVRVRFELLEPDGQGAARDAVTAAEDRVALGRAARVLDERERYLIAMHYLGDRTQAQLAEGLGISPAHACRLLGRALAKLRAELGEPEPVPPALAAERAGA